MPLVQIDEDTWVDPARVIVAEHAPTGVEGEAYTLVHVACMGGGIHCLIVKRPVGEVAALLNGQWAP